MKRMNRELSIIQRISIGLRWRGRVLQEKGWGKTRMGRWVVDTLLFPADIMLIRRIYRTVFGEYPRLWRSRTFNEKLQRAKLFRRRARYTHYTDKIKVREIVKNRVGAEVLNELLWCGKDLREAQKVHLPDAFIIKANNGSGTNLIVRDAESLDWEAAREGTIKWFKRGHDRDNAEWQYRWIEPRLLIEPLLAGARGGLPLDYKFFCFHGRAELLQVDVDRFTNHTRVLLDRSFNRLPVGLKYPRYEGEVPKPECFNEMIRIAELLARGESFLRVDLYDCGKPVFGELTLTPESGLGLFDPPEWDYRIGAFW